MIVVVGEASNSGTSGYQAAEAREDYCFNLMTSIVALSPPKADTYEAPYYTPRRCCIQRLIMADCNGCNTFTL